MAAGVAFKPAAMAEGLLAAFPSSLFPSKSSLSFLRFPRPSNSILFLHASRPTWSLSFREKLRLLPFVARTSDWARQVEYEVEEGVGVRFDEYDEDEEDEGGIVAEGDDSFVEGEEEEEEEEDSSEERPEGAKLFVGNLPYDMDSEKLAELFDKAGIVEVAEVIYNRETDRSRGFGFVTMSTVEEAKKAVEMFNRYEVGGRTLTVNKAAPRGSRVERTPRERDFEPSSRIYVGNLPWGVDDSRLEQVFSEHGKVLEARVVYDRETGRSRGFGFVKMATQADVDDAIAALDGQSLDGRTIRVNTADERPRRPAF